MYDPEGDMFYAYNLGQTNITLDFYDVSCWWKVDNTYVWPFTSTFKFAFNFLSANLLLSLLFKMRAIGAT